MIWLIGCKGMLGTEIARQLTENNMEFAGTGRDVDVTSAQELADFAKGKNISYIINCSAYTAVDKAESDVELAKKLNIEVPVSNAIYEAVYTDITPKEILEKLMNRKLKHED